jgi:hypothetical protein
MLLRAWFIAALGSIEGDHLLDIKTVTDSFVAELPCPLEDALEKIKQWQKEDLPLASRLPIEDVRKLRNVKNRLVGIKLLLDAGILPTDSSLHQWIVIREELP